MKTAFASFEDQTACSSLLIRNLLINYKYSSKLINLLAEPDTSTILNANKLLCESAKCYYHFVLFLFFFSIFFSCFVDFRRVSLFLYGCLSHGFHINVSHLQLTLNATQVEASSFESTVILFWELLKFFMRLL